MRISKKFVGNSAIGKQVYKLQQTSIDEMTEAQHRKRCEVISLRIQLFAQPYLHRQDLRRLELNFLEANQLQTQRQMCRKASSSAQNISSGLLQQQNQRRRRRRDADGPMAAADASFSLDGDGENLCLEGSNLIHW
jgi:hypothetical protein